MYTVTWILPAPRRVKAGLLLASSPPSILPTPLPPPSPPPTDKLPTETEVYRRNNLINSVDNCR